MSSITTWLWAGSDERKWHWCSYFPISSIWPQNCVGQAPSPKASHKEYGTHIISVAVNWERRSHFFMQELRDGSFHDVVPLSFFSGHLLRNLSSNLFHHKKTTNCDMVILLYNAWIKVVKKNILASETIHIHPLDSSFIHTTYHIEGALVGGIDAFEVFLRPSSALQTASEHVHDSTNFLQILELLVLEFGWNYFKTCLRPCTLTSPSNLPSFLPSFLLHRHHLRHHRQFLVFLVGDKNKNISIWFLWRNFILGLLLFCGWSFEVYTFSEFGRIIRLRCSPPRGFEVGVALSSSTSCYCWTEIMWTLLLILSLGSRLILTDKLAYT